MGGKWKNLISLLVHSLGKWISIFFHALNTSYKHKFQYFYLPTQTCAIKVQNPIVYMLICFCGFNLNPALVKRACLISLVYRRGSFQAVQSFAPDAGKLWFLNFNVYSYHFWKALFRAIQTNVIKQLYQLHITLSLPV